MGENGNDAGHAPWTDNELVRFLDCLCLDYFDDIEHRVLNLPPEVMGGVVDSIQSLQKRGNWPDAFKKALAGKPLIDIGTGGYFPGSWVNYLFGEVGISELHLVDRHRDPYIACLASYGERNVAKLYADIVESVRCGKGPYKWSFVGQNLDVVSESDFPRLWELLYKDAPTDEFVKRTFVHGHMDALEFLLQMRDCSSNIMSNRVDEWVIPPVMDGYTTPSNGDIQEMWYQRLSQEVARVIPDGGLLLLYSSLQCMPKKSEDFARYVNADPVLREDTLGFRVWLRTGSAQIIGGFSQKAVNMTAISDVEK